MSATGNAWHQEGRDADIPFVRAAVELCGESFQPVRVRWWANVLRSDALYKPHKHDGRWAFVYHLTAGASLFFENGESFAAVPGQILVFDSQLQHWTDRVQGDAPRVSIAGNLYFRR